MSPAPPDPTDDQLGDLLREVGAHLDLGPGATEEGRADLVAAVLAALPEAPVEPVDGGSAPGSARPAADRRRPRGCSWPPPCCWSSDSPCSPSRPAREAVARWLGIGAVRIERTDQPVVTGPASSTSPAAVAPTRPDGSVDVEAVARRVPFEVRLPTAEVAGEPTAASTDPAVPSGLIEVRYPGFTLVELASQPGGAPVLAKFLGPGTDDDAGHGCRPARALDHRRPSRGRLHRPGRRDPAGPRPPGGRRAAVGGRRRDLPHRGRAVARRGARRRRLPPLIPDAEAGTSGARAV